MIVPEVVSEKKIQQGWLTYLITSHTSFIIGLKEVLPKVQVRWLFFMKSDKFKVEKCAVVIKCSSIGNYNPVKKIFD